MVEAGRKKYMSKYISLNLALNTSVGIGFFIIIIIYTCCLLTLCQAVY